MTDILIGAADLYSWNDIKQWVVSARQSGFDGEIWLICYRINDDILSKADKWNVNLYNAENDAYGQPINHGQRGSPTQAHNLRFYHAWELLTRLGVENYQHVILTDVRDVIFQINPSDYLNSFVPFPYITYIRIASEGIKYKDEPWNKDNLIQGYGHVFWNLVASEWQAYNVGTLAGSANEMKNFCHTIFRMTEQRYYPSDQSSANVLIRNSNFPFILTPMDLPWAAQLGTTHDPTKSYLWEHNNEGRPIILEDGTVVTQSGMKFNLVHQWDRVPHLKSIILNKYSNE